MKKKIATEAESRASVLKLAKAQGCEPEAKQILDRYTLLLARCTNPAEKKQIATLGLVELHRLLNCQGGLAVMNVKDGQIVGGEQILPDNPLAKDVMDDL